MEDWFERRVFSAARRQLTGSSDDSDSDCSEDEASADSDFDCESARVHGGRDAEHRLERASGESLVYDDDGSDTDASSDDDDDDDDDDDAVHFAQLFLTSFGGRRVGPGPYADLARGGSVAHVAAAQLPGGGGGGGGAPCNVTLHAYDPDEEYRVNEVALSQEERRLLGLPLARVDLSVRQLGGNRTAPAPAPAPRPTTTTTATAGGDKPAGSKRSAPCLKVPGDDVKFDVVGVYMAFLSMRREDDDGGGGANDAGGAADANQDSFWHLVNRFVGSFSPHMHCELIFMVRARHDGTMHRLVSSIHRSHELRVIKKQYRRKALRQWRFFHYDCDETRRAAMFAHECAADRTPFNRIGFMWNFVVPLDTLRVDYAGERVFCSEQICRNLVHTHERLHAALQPYATHPTALLAYMTGTCGTQASHDAAASHTPLFRECQEPSEASPAPVYV